MKKLFGTLLTALILATGAFADRVIDCAEYAISHGDSLNDTTLAEIATGVGSTPHKFILSGGTWTVSNNRTFASTISWYIAPDSVFSIATNKTLTIQGTVYTDTTNTWYTGDGTNTHTGVWLYPQLVPNSDTIVSNALVSYVDAEIIAVSNTLETGYIAADTVVSNGVVTGYTSADTVVSNGLTTAYTSADTTVSNGLVTGYTGADTTLSNALQALLDLKEDSLGNPATNGFVLSSTTNGTRSWVAQSSGSGSGFPLTQNEDGAGYGISNLFLYPPNGDTNAYFAMLSSTQAVLRLNSTNIYFNADPEYPVNSPWQGNVDANGYALSGLSGVTMDNGIALESGNATAVGAGSAQSVSSGVVTKLTNLVDVVIDQPSAWSVANTRYDCPKDGKYLAYVSISTGSLDAGKRAFAYIYTNGVVNARGRNHMGSIADAATVNTTSIIDLQAGDYIEAFLYHTDAGALDALSTFELTRLCIQYIGE